MAAPDKLSPRHLAPAVQAALQDTPVVCVLGPRQSGKTTLVQSLAPGRAFVSLDEPDYLYAAAIDPAGFIASLLQEVTLDEVQRAPGLLPVVKREVDRNRRPARFLLTGSANLLLLSKTTESLAGRMEIAQLHPLTEAEKARRPGGGSASEAPRASSGRCLPALPEAGRRPPARARIAPCAGGRRRHRLAVRSPSTMPVSRLSISRSPPASARSLRISACHASRSARASVRYGPSDPAVARHRGLRGISHRRARLRRSSKTGRSPRPPLATASGTSTRASASPESRSAPPGVGLGRSGPGAAALR